MAAAFGTGFSAPEAPRERNARREAADQAKRRRREEGFTGNIEGILAGCIVHSMGERVLRPRHAVAVTALGAVTAFGSGVEAFWRGVLEGRSAIGPLTRFSAAPYRSGVAAEVPEGSLFGPERKAGTFAGTAADLVLAAAREALGGRGRPPAPERLGVVVGTSMGGNGALVDWVRQGAPSGGHRPDPLFSVASVLASEVGARGPSLCVSVACASGTVAVGIGADMIRKGECDAVLVGGVDLLSEFVFAGFDSLRALSATGARPFDRRRDGLTLGEGAALLLLEDDARARREGRPPLALVGGYGSAADAHHMTRPSPSGEGLIRAVRSALSDAAVVPDEIGFVSAHGTATVFNDRMEAAAFRSLFGERSIRVPSNSIKGAVGHTLGAAGALEALLCALVLERSQIPPTAGFEEPDPECALDVVAGTARPLPGSVRHILSTSSAFAGTNAALVFERP
jgi:3-oxoacyl-[acyl-carrier-protein] synthase II